MQLGYYFEESIMIVDISGELDHHNADEVRRRIDDWIDRFNTKKLILDLSGVSFMDSSGIGIVIGRYKKISLRNGNINIINTNEALKKVFDLSGLFKIVKSFKDKDKAIADIRGDNHEG